MIHYGFIGCGKMGSALLRSVVKKVPQQNVMIYDRAEEITQPLKEELHVEVAKSFEDILSFSEVIVLAVKPQNFEEVLSTMKGKFQENQVLLSIAAGLTIEQIQKLAGEPIPVIRIMPSLCAAVGKGCLLSTYAGSCEKTFDAFKQDFSECGRILELGEEDFDAASAISGCGPAFVSSFASGLIKGGVASGLSENLSKVLALETILGTADLILKTGIEPDVLTKNVCSPGGTTIEGVHVLENHHFDQTLIDTILASYQKSIFLKNQANK